MKVIDGDGGGGEAEEKRKSDLEQWENTREEAKAKGWGVIQKHAEEQIEALKPTASKELDIVKGTKTVISARVNLVHTHETKTKALETKCNVAAKAKFKHKEALEQLIKTENERHEKTIKAHKEDMDRAIKKEDDII